MLLRWTPAEQVPSEVIPHLDQNIEIAQHLIQPAEDKAWAVVMYDFIGWIERFGIVALDPVGSEARKKALSTIVFGLQERSS